MRGVKYNIGDIMIKQWFKNIKNFFKHKLFGQRPNIQENVGETSSNEMSSYDMRGYLGVHDSGTTAIDVGNMNTTGSTHGSLVFGDAHIDNIQADGRHFEYGSTDSGSSLYIHRMSDPEDNIKTFIGILCVDKVKGKDAKNLELSPNKQYTLTINEEKKGEEVWVMYDDNGDSGCLDMKCFHIQNNEMYRHLINEKCTE